MNLKLASFLSLSIGALVLAAPAQAFSPFTFKTNFSPNPVTDPKADVMLQSVVVGSKTISDFLLVNDAKILQNNDGLGPSSSDRGDKVAPKMCPRNEKPTVADIVGSLGNLNLNCIIDTEDKGASVINVYFQQAANQFYFWERGGNSDLQVREIFADGTLGATFLLDRTQGAPTGFSIDTLEITGAQKVVSYGLQSAKKIAGLQLISKVGFNGPDYKVVAAAVPEPGMLVGLGAVAGAAWLNRRKKAATANAEA